MFPFHLPLSMLKKNKFVCLCHNTLSGTLDMGELKLDIRLTNEITLALFEMLYLR